MKYTIIFAYALTAFSISLSQIEKIQPKRYSTSRVLTGILNIKWGESPTSVKQKILQRNGVKFDVKNSDSKITVFAGGKLGSFSVDMWVFQFNDQNQLHTAKVIFEKTLEALVIEQYGNIKRVLIDQYGTPSEDLFSFKWPYEDAKAGEREMAIGLGKADILSFWEFPVEDSSSNSISLTIETYMQVRLSYQNGEMIHRYLQDVNKEF